MWKVEKSVKMVWAVSHYLNGYGQMSCVTSCWKAYQNTSGHGNILLLCSATAGAACHFRSALGKCGSFVVMCLCRLTRVVLGFIRRVAELHVEVDAEDGIAVVVPGDWGGEVRDASLDKGLTAALCLLAGVRACGHCVALSHYSTRTRQGEINVMV